jgi:hypothetical protein
MVLQPVVGHWPLFQFLDLFTQSVGPSLREPQILHRINATYNHRMLRSVGEMYQHNIGQRHNNFIYRDID